MNTTPKRNEAFRIFTTGLILACLICGHFSHAQETGANVDWNKASDTQVLLQAVELLPTSPAASAPRVGTFYSAQHAPGTRQPWPPLPANSWQLPVWNLGDGIYLLDDLEWDYSTPLTLSGMMMTPNGFPGGITNIGSVPLIPRPVYTTNDLWLEITGKNNQTAFLTIHPSWNIIKEVYDLYYTTNLSAPESWSWVLRSQAGQTNLTVNNATDEQGFYRLGPLNDPIGNDSLGTNFWLAFLYMGPYGDSSAECHLWLYISSPAGASGTVAIPGLGITNTFTVESGAVTNVSVTTNAMMENWPWGIIGSNGIHVVSSQPVSVYALCYGPARSAGFTSYPTTLLGTNYCLLARPGLVSAGDSEAAIVATEDNTTVNVFGCATADLIEFTNYNIIPVTNFSITLQQGEVYQITSSGQDAVPPSYNHYDDLTGTRIESDKPVAVFAGADLGFVPVAATGAGNPLVQQQLPVEDWGTQILGLSFAGRTNGDSYRVLAAYSNTVVTVTGTVVTLINSGQSPCAVTKTNETVVTNLAAGQFFDIIVEGPVEFQASQPIQVAQFANGAYFDAVNNTKGEPYEGDPCEILLPPTGHYLMTNIVYAPLYNTNSTGDFDENFLNLIVPQSATNSTFVDSLQVAVTNFEPIGASGYYGTQLTVTNGSHTVTSSRPVGVEAYGFGLWDS